MEPIGGGQDAMLGGRARSPPFLQNCRLVSGPRDCYPDWGPTRSFTLLDFCIMPARAVVFDLDGLMFNTEDVYWIVGTRLMERRGYAYTRELADAMMGRPPQAAFDVMIRWYSLADAWESLAVESEAIYIGLLDEHLAPMPGLMELLDTLEREGLPKAICTSSSRRTLEAVLSRFSLEPRFQFTLTADDILHGKPNPEIYLKAARRFDLRPDEMLVLEDSQTGCRAAAAAGAYVVAVPGEHSVQHDFGVASLVVSSLADPRLYAALGFATTPGKG
jgi:HAD superfamily hydrolase (TIGR01509 family)